MEVHLDLVGGLAGDMFIAAFLDAFPEHETAVTAAIQTVSTENPVACTLRAFKDDVLLGRQFCVSAASRVDAKGVRAVTPFSAAAQPHSHTSWAHIRRRIEDAPLSPAVIGHALQIFKLLADAEAKVHGIEVEQVSFHEVGAWDSIADIVGAATLIEALGVSRWSASPVPLGSGRVATAHGVLPVPAPATAQLLMGMTMVDDGVAGERVTPTGAAILRYVCPPSPVCLPHAVRSSGADCTPRARGEPSRVRTLIASGSGFGSRRLPGISNHVRVLCFEPAAKSTSSATATATAAAEARRRIEVLEFEIDDQTAEDLAAGLDRLRRHGGVLDVTQAPVFGKKGRIMIHVQVLARAAQVESVIDACFRETTTLGLRQRSVQGIGLERQMRDVQIEGQRVRVKVAKRPGGYTAKTESDDVLSQTQAGRAALRRRAESEALQGQLSDA